MQGQRNATVLREMDEDGSNSKGWGMEEKIQALDTVLSGLWNITEGGGRYMRVVRKFERWVGAAEEVLETRSNGSNFSEIGPRDGGVAFVNSMEVSWRDECDGLSRKLEGWRAHLRDVGDVDVRGRGDGDGGSSGGESSLSLVVKGVNSLVRGMQQELSVMRTIETELVRSEEAWIRETIGSGDGDSDDEGETPGAAWRSY